MPCKIVGGMKVPGNEKSWERKFLGTKDPWNESKKISASFRLTGQPVIGKFLFG